MKNGREKERRLVTIDSVWAAGRWSLVHRGQGKPLGGDDSQAAVPLGIQ